MGEGSIGAVSWLQLELRKAFVGICWCAAEGEVVR